MKKQKIIVISLIISLLALAGIVTGVLWKSNQDKQTAIIEPTETIVLETEVTEEPEPQKIRLMMLGDNLMHMGIVKTGVQADGTRDYSFLFENISEYLEYADIKMINQETILAGNERGFSGFPYFNSPTEVGDAIAEAGFNVVLHSSNHTADQGIDGIYNCLEFWAQYPDIIVTGMFENPGQENEDIALLEIDGVTFAILNYTYGPNMETLVPSVQGHIGMLCDWNESTGLIDFTTIHPDVLTDIAQAEQLADVVIVCPHWGAEYISEPTSYQEKFALQMTEAGADLIIGTHPHVVQPVEWIESENGNRALCYYSLGNYVSTQQTGLSMLEAMAWVTFVVEEDGVKIVEEETGVIPMVCHYVYSPTRLESVYFLDEYTEEQAANHGIHGYGGVNLTLADLQTWSEEILGDWVLSSDEVLEK